MMHIIMFSSVCLFVSSVPGEDHIYTADSPAPLIMAIGFILSNIASSSIYTANLTLLTKSIATCTTSRGVLLGAEAFCNSCGVLLIDGLGGHIYDINKRNPFFIIITSEGLTILLCIGLALAKQLRI